MAIVGYVPEFNPKSDYNLLASRVLPSLQGTETSAVGEVPSYEDVSQRLAPLGEYFTQRFLDGCDDRLVIAPRIGGKSGMGMSWLLNRARMLGAVKPNPYVTTDDIDPIHDNGLSKLSGYDVAVLLGDKKSPKVLHGLVFTNKTLDEQCEALRLDIHEHAQEGRTLVAATVGMLVVDTLARRSQLVQVPNGMRINLVHYPTAAYRGISECVPSITTDHSSTLRILPKPADHGTRYDIGVQRAVRI